ncbi:hypothetical protein R83H12_00336 [Fibrobacteria bacterium R8-3-H12]
MKQYFLLGMVFFFVSCSDVERGNPDDPGGKNYIGQQVVSSSSSKAMSSSGSSAPPSTSSSVFSSSSMPSSSSAAVSSSSFYLVCVLENEKQLVKIAPAFLR